MVGKYTEDYFAKRIQELQRELRNELPSIDEDARTAFLSCCETVQSSLDAKIKAESLVDELRKQKADQVLIDKASEVLESCDLALKNSQDGMAAAAKPILKNLHLATFLQEAILLECTILVQATAKGLAEWVVSDVEANSKLLKSFLSDVAWMKQMIIGGGASNGNYGPAIKIHSTLLSLLFHKPTPVRHKLALAVALEHATPIMIFKTSNHESVDPIARFWHYVHAFENNELDEKFSTFSVFEMRLIVDSNARDEELTWGREMLKAYRPDEITDFDYQWKYLWSVRSDCNYRQPDHEFHSYKELISAGGECGPRAFFGRFICKAWGTPTWGVRQPGHAALSRWTPSGWKVCLGAAFKWSRWTDNRAGTNQEERGGQDFLEETQARMACYTSSYYELVNRLECIADCMGETVSDRVDSERLWRSLSLAERQILATERELKGEPLQSEQPSVCRPRNCSRAQYSFLQLESDNTIVIPATAFVEPKMPDKKKILVSKSYLGGDQLHLEHDGSVAFKLPDFLPPGKYDVSARLVTIHRFQVPLQFYVEVSSSTSSIRLDVQVPYTGGQWEQAKLLDDLALGGGSVIRIARISECHGLTIKDFILEKNNQCNSM